MSQNSELIGKYLNALSEGDYDKVGSFMSDDLVWHQPGNGALSGDFKGKGAVFAHLGDFARLSNGTFTIDKVDYVAANSDLVAVAIHFKATSENSSIDMRGIDLFRIESGKIQEVWLFSENIEAEDEFWESLARR